MLTVLLVLVDVLDDRVSDTVSVRDSDDEVEVLSDSDRDCEELPVADVVRDVDVDRDVVFRVDVRWYVRVLVIPRLSVWLLALVFVRDALRVSVAV